MTVLAMVLRESLWITLAGFALGLPLCIILSRLLHAQLYQLNPLDPVSFLVAITLTLFVVICAALLPARSAASLNPMEALRAE